MSEWPKRSVVNGGVIWDQGPLGMSAAFGTINDYDREVTPVSDVREPDPESWDEYIDRTFTYHAPTPTQIPLYEDIRAKAKEFALFLVEVLPESALKEEALQHIDVAVMRANAAVARWT